MPRDALADVVRSARRLLWMRGAIGQGLTATPTLDRQIWLMANSAANGPMFSCLVNNAAGIDRVISCDAIGENNLILVTAGVPAMTAATAVRARSGRTLSAFVVTTPHMWTSGKTAYVAIRTKVIATKADVTMLPPDAEWDAYWTYPPTATSNPLLFEALRARDGNGLAASKRFRTGHPIKEKARQWLFWHEWSVDGGYLTPAPGDGSAPPSVRTFLDDVLNA